MTAALRFSEPEGLEVARALVTYARSKGVAGDDAEAAAIAFQLVASSLSTDDADMAAIVVGLATAAGSILAFWNPSNPQRALRLFSEAVAQDFLEVRRLLAAQAQPGRA